MFGYQLQANHEHKGDCKPINIVKIKTGAVSTQL